MKAGIIAEDNSDVAVIRELTLTLLKPHTIGFRKFVGNGSGKLRRKCGAWAKLLVREGCRWVMIVHDLDTFDEASLRTQLESVVFDIEADATVVLIPKREIEAWLLYDPRAIALAFRENSEPGLPGKPENLQDPKKYLRDLIWRKYQKQYLNTIHNAAIAKHIKTRLLKPCTSFSPHFEFAATVKLQMR